MPKFGGWPIFHMHNPYAIFAKYPDICKQIAWNLADER